MRAAYQEKAFSKQQEIEDSCTKKLCSGGQSATVYTLVTDNRNSSHFCFRMITQTALNNYSYFWKYIYI